MDGDRIDPARASGAGCRSVAGDLDGDGRAEIITAPGPGAAPLVRAFHPYASGGLGEMTSFYAYQTDFGGGVFVAGLH